MLSTTLRSHRILEGIHTNPSILDPGVVQAQQVRVVEVLGELSHQKLNPTAAHYRRLRVRGYGLHEGKASIVNAAVVGSCNAVSILTFKVVKHCGIMPLFDKNMVPIGYLFMITFQNHG